MLGTRQKSKINKLTTINQAIDAQERVLKLLEDRPELQGIGITQSQDRSFGLEIHLSSPLPDDLGCCDQFEDIPIEYEIVGEIFAA
jgi:hypothetical protein